MRAALVVSPAFEDEAVFFPGLIGVMCSFLAVLFSRFCETQTGSQPIGILETMIRQPWPGVQFAYANDDRSAGEIVKRAAELNVSVDRLVSQTLDRAVEEPALEGFRRLGPPATQEERDRATAVIRDIASRHRLGGLKIKDLIEEGRRL